jgi:hypothetical protein
MMEPSETPPDALTGFASRDTIRPLNRRGFATGMHTIVTSVPLARGCRCSSRGISSYVDDFIVSIAACREMMPDPAVYMGCVEESVEELRAAS